jgi:virulence factor Mce-like protein
VVRRIVPLVLLLGALAVLVTVLGSTTGADLHRVGLTVPDATNVVPGQFVRAGGEDVGRVASIEPVDRGRKVRVELDIEDAAWPLRKGAKLELRFGGTASFVNRYIALTPGPESAEPYADGATIPASRWTSPVEFDSLLGAFTPSARAGIRKLVDEAGPAVEDARPGLVATLSKTPAALEQTRAVMVDLDASQERLDALLRQTDAVVDAVATADPGLQRLLTGAAQTFDAVAERQGRLAQTLKAAPGTLTNLRTTLATADGTPLNRVLGTVVRVGPDARGTLETARRATPALNPLLTKLTAQLPQLEAIGRSAAEELACLRPYSPEIASFFSNWGSFASGTDGRDKYFRANVLVPTAVNTNLSGYSSAEAVKMFPGTTYGFPRPPGQAAGQPWFMPGCGVGPDTLDPTKDGETR